MAGDFSIQAAFKKSDYTELTRAKLGVDVLVDLSHNEFTTTTTHPDGRQVIKKAIELDVRIDRGSSTETTFQELSKLPSTSAAFQIYKGIKDLGGWPTLNQRSIKVEAPNYDTSVVNLQHDALQKPAAAARAPSAAEFMKLSEAIRLSMGMYRWNAQTGGYALSGQPEKMARTAP
ncbi:hypothetical protein [Chondromyces crocatus]|uniref:Uncharacterized protein n=1 Tax=Chondromyces crocatus TaxID=52 RepID=A0A0K1EK95_CHOCO|nr:hypothetical protein [Chondromyces crocatus]AKT41285.1 uncharacterized protein CMC5_054520 [Chondromyces crocatus]